MVRTLRSSLHFSRPSSGLKPSKATTRAADARFSRGISTPVHANRIARRKPLFQTSPPTPTQRVRILLNCMLKSAHHPFPFPIFWHLPRTSTSLGLCEIYVGGFIFFFPQRYRYEGHRPHGFSRPGTYPCESPSAMFCFLNRRILAELLLQHPAGDPGTGEVPRRPKPANYEKCEGPCQRRRHPHSYGVRA